MNRTAILSATFPNFSAGGVNFGKKTFLILTGALLFSLLAVYVVQVSSLTKDYYRISNYREAIKDLSGSNEILEASFSYSSSLSNIESYIAEQNFEKSKFRKFIQIVENQVAKR